MCNEHQSKTDNAEWPTSWSSDADSRWGYFRDLVNAGVDVDVAADRAGVE